MIPALGGPPLHRRARQLRPAPPGPGQLLMLAQDGGGLQGLQRMGKQDLGGLGPVLACGVVGLRALADGQVEPGEFRVVDLERPGTLIGQAVNIGLRDLGMRHEQSLRSTDF